MPQGSSPQSQPRWDEEEGLILADACIKVHNNVAPRKSLIATTSTLLRYRAEKLGMHPSEKFRNQDGIGMQMISLEREMYGDTRGTWHTTALFREVGRMFREQPEQFYQKLKVVQDRWIIPSPTAEMSDA
ncbi:MAG: hypothetical protein MR698_11560 [Selenomonas sp.]|nr:hypothetical protein [Selenomonas sp.]